MVVVFLVTLFTFLLFQLIPGGSYTLARSVLGSHASKPAIEHFISTNGYNLPWYRQYWKLIDGYFHLNFGYSYKNNETVRELMGLYMPRSLVLITESTILALLIAIPLGVFQTVRRNKASDYVLSSLAFIFYAMPPFVLGSLLILYLAVDHHFFAAVVPPSASAGQLIFDWRSMTLPIITLATGTVALFSRYMRSSLMDSLGEDYVRTAKAKGASRSRVLFRHAFRNALIPIITLLGIYLPNVVSGAVITETVFSFPGMGYLTTQAAQNYDIYVVMGTTVVATVATVVGSLLADILYAVLDPRIRYVSA